MGLDVRRNEKGEYQLISTNTNGSYHPEKEWISEDEAKVILMDLSFFRFIEDIIKIDMTFPKDYRVNDKINLGHTNFNEFMSTAYRSDDCDNIITTKFEEIYERLKLTFKI